ncbi:MAG TPA: DUF4350 domain-containing protein [Rhodanobacteraceae bacterium]|nr:DUF4350 domain-containing protein [Rhodanobacteraceae bacterium]
MGRRLGGWIGALLLLVGAACIAYLSTRWTATVDLSAGARASIPAQVQALLRELPQPIHITCYASPGSGLRPTVAGFIARYQRFKPDITLTFVDPEADPEAMRKAGIRVDGELEVRYGSRSQRLDQISDTVMADTLARLARGGERLVAFVTGAGERRADGRANADLGNFMGQLEASGTRAVPLDFARTAEVPEGTGLVVLASPLLPLAPGAVQALTRYVANGGNLLWLTEPDPRDLGLAPLAQALGVRRLPGTLVDGANSAINRGDPSFVVVSSYPAGPVDADFALTTLFPHAVALAQVNGGDWRVQSILRSSSQSWNETGDIPQPGEGSGTIRLDADQGELRGPLDFGLALTRLSPSPAHNQQRVLVVGDGDFLSNSFLGNGGNRALGQRMFNWLLGDDALMDLPPRGAPDRHLALSQTMLNMVGLGFLVALPLLLLLIAATVAWRRRRH